MSRIKDKLTDPKFQAACERIIANPNAIPEGKATARAMLYLTHSGRERLTAATPFMPPDKR